MPSKESAEPQQPTSNSLPPPLESKTDPGTSVLDLREIMRQFVDERDWRKFHNAKNLSMSLAIEAGELMEHFQWLTTEETVAGEGYDLAEVRDELADCTCYILALANALDIDLTQAITDKMVKNRAKYPPGEPHFR